MEENQSAGFLLINKPAGPTSFDCIRIVKRLLPKKTKVGHSGTLDDFASGLLIVCIGRPATRMVPLLMKCDKEYVVRAKLGELTDSLDRTGVVVENRSCPSIHPSSPCRALLGARDERFFRSVRGECFESTSCEQNVSNHTNGQVTAEQLQAAMRELMPSYTQIPPIYSALKHEGKSLYKLARYKRMETDKLDAIVQQKGREVKISTLELLDFEPPFFTFRAVVSSGTYVRSLANDIATRCGTNATTYDLERTKIHSLSVQDAPSLQKVAFLADITEVLVSVEKMQILMSQKD